MEFVSKLNPNAIKQPARRSREVFGFRRGKENNLGNWHINIQADWYKSKPSLEGIEDQLTHQRIMNIISKATYLKGPMKHKFDSPFNYEFVPLMFFPFFHYFITNLLMFIIVFKNTSND